MEQKKELVRNTVVIAIGKVSTQILSFLLLPLYTAKLSPTEYGIYDFLVTLSVFLLPIITLLMEESMFRFLIDAEKKEEKSKVITQTILYTILATIGFSIIAWIVVTVIHYEYGIIFIIFVISNILIGLSNALARGLGKIKMYSLSNFILGALTIALNILLIVVFKWGVYGLLGANLLANSLTALFIFKKLHLSQFISKNSFDSKILREMVTYSIPLVPNSLSWIIISLSDRVIIKSVLGDAANGIYSIANRFPNILYTVYGIFNTAWKESAAKIVKEENKTAYYNSIYADMKKFLFSAVICLIAVMPFIFPILINQEYNEAYNYIPLLILSIYYSNISSFYGGIFGAYKNTKIMGSTTVVAAILNIVINVIFIGKIGLHAAVISTFLSNVMINAYRKRALKKYIRLRELRMIGPFLILMVIAICYYCNNWIGKGIGLVIAVGYSILLNKTFLVRIKEVVVRKVFRRA